MNARPLLLWAALASCSGSEEVHWPAPPAIPGAQSMIIVLIDDRGTSRFAFELDVGGALAGPVDIVTVEGRAKPMLTAFYYEMSLEELSLGVGALDSADDCLLAHPMFVAESEGGDWIEAVDAIGRLIDAESCRVSSVCRSFRVSTLPLEGSANVRASLALDDTRALIAANDGSFYQATFTEAVKSTAYEGQPHHAAMIDREGALWLAGGGPRENSVNLLYWLEAL